MQLPTHRQATRCSPAWWRSQSHRYPYATLAAEALREWDAQAEERKLKQQQDAARNAKPQTRAMITRFDEEEYSELLEGARERVSEALAAALAPAAACGAT
jgi:hypothetical protein